MLVFLDGFDAYAPNPSAHYIPKPKPMRNGRVEKWYYSVAVIDTAIEIPCPTCKAPIGERCGMPSHRNHIAPHDARVNKYLASSLSAQARMMDEEREIFA